MLPHRTGSPTPSCWRMRAGIRVWWASSPRALPRNTAARRSSSAWTGIRARRRRAPTGAFNLFRALYRSCRSCWRATAGTSWRRALPSGAKISTPFREAICARAAEFCALGRVQRRACMIDCCDPAGSCCRCANVAALDELEPCGAGCPRPVLCMTNLTVTELSRGRRRQASAAAPVARAAELPCHLSFRSNALRAAVAVGDTVDIAFTPQINDFRALRTVQLNLIDIRPDEAARQSRRLTEGIYRKFISREPLLPEEVEALLPQRCDFVAVWRYLAASAQDGRLLDEIGCLSRQDRPPDRERVRPAGGCASVWTYFPSRSSCACARSAARCRSPCARAGIKPIWKAARSSRA